MTLLILTAMSAMMSCRDELCYDHFPSLAVALSWEHEWERDYGMNHPANWDETRYNVGYDALRPGKPEWVNLIRFYPDSTRRENYIGNEGDEIMVDEGDGMSLLLYNGDTEYIILSDMASPPEARASATGRSRSSLSYLSEKHPSARTTNPPDVLYSAYIPDVSGMEKHEHRHLPVKMQPLVYTYVIRYEFEYGNEYITSAQGALGGMAESVYLLDGRTSEETAIILFDCKVTDYGCEARVRSFGVPAFPDEYYGRADKDAPDRPYTLNLEVGLSNGNRVEFNADISDQIARQPRGGVITVTGLRVEDEESHTAAGFDIGIDEWGNRVDIDLPVVWHPKER